jgi:hypothetical protein
MAIKRRYSFHVDPQISDAQIKAVLQTYPSDINSTPTGVFSKSGDTVQIEMYLYNVTSEIINLVEVRLRNLLEKITARSAIPAVEIGPVPAGANVPLPETNVTFKAPGGGDWMDFLENVFGKVSVVLVIIAVILGIIVYLRAGR